VLIIALGLPSCPLYMIFLFAYERSSCSTTF
jgi:hypothetical protein